MAMNPRLLRPLASGFSPRQIAGLAAWWDSTDNSKITTDTGVSAWVDKANGYTLAQAVGANQPTISSINGKQAFDYNGSSQFLRSGDAGLAAEASGAAVNATTVFYVLETDFLGVQNPMAWANSANTQSVYSALRMLSTTWALFYRPDTGGGSNGVFTDSSVSYATGVPYVVATQTGSDIVARVNGSEVANETNTVAAEAMTVNRFSVGALDRSSLSAYYNGRIGDVLIYNRVLTATEIQKIEGYLAWKYGLQAQLPYDHPYAKSFPGFGSQATPTDADTLTYLAAVKAADGTGVEVGVANAVDAFVTGCKSDGIWDAIKASCILAGARTLAGALVPLKGAAPTNNNFTASDYNRETGLVGDGSTTYLDSNRNNEDDPQDSQHMAVYASTVGTSVYMGSGGVAVANGFSNMGLGATRSRNISFEAWTSSTGLLGISRSSSTGYARRVGGSSDTQVVTSQTPLAGQINVFESGTLYGNHRLAFYSIGEALDLEALDTRVTALITAIGAAI